MNIFNLTSEYLQLVEMLEDPDITTEEQELVDTSLESVEYELELKAQSYACVIKQLETDAASINDEIKRLKKIKKTIDDNTERMKQTVLACMMEAGISELGNKPYSLRVYKNGGLAPLEVDLAPEELPEEFQKVTIEADNKAIREYLKELPKDVDCPWARLNAPGYHLAIK